MEKIKNPYLSFSTKNILLFCFIWLCIGFSTGTFILIYPVHWITDYAAINDWSSSRENNTIKFVIFLFVIISFLISLQLLKIYYKLTSKKIIILFVFSLISITSLNLWLWFNPAVMTKLNPGKLTSEYTKGAQFNFGPYPTEDALQELKDSDYKLVISLLHPSVLPFEPKLIKDEEKAVAKVGIKYIHIPMLPWVSDNLEVIKKLKEIIKTEKGKIYVHCNLGRDRANVVKSLIKNNNGIVVHTEKEGQHRKLTDIKKFERGDIIQLEKEVFLIPYPTDEEYFGYILASPIKNVVSLLNPADKENLVLIKKEEKLLKSHEITLHQMPLTVDSYNPNAALKIVQSIKKLPRPIVIHAFFTKGAIPEAFLLTYKTNKQSLPPALFKEPMKNGTPIVISSNVIAGATPLESEFKSYLFKRGIRNIAFIGNKKATEVNLLATKAINSGLTWKNYDLNDPALLKNLKADGTWYIFGSPLVEIKKTLIGKN
jgi:protein tyrosine phosphatase (PTP) superfamily phosphohydrolase (DUF442 family)